MGGSRGEGVQWSDGLVSGFQGEAALDLVVEQLGVLHHVLVALDSAIADDAAHFYAVVDAVAAAHHVEGAGK